MLRRFDDAIRGMTGIIAHEADRLCGRIDTSIADEDDFTSRLIDRIERAADGVIINGVRWSIQTRKLTSRGKGSEESRFGADFGLVIQMEGNGGFNVAKGYLIQAKKEIADFPYHPADRLVAKLDKRLPDQARKMLQTTPESYVWFYTKHGIEILRAGMIVDGGSAHVNELMYQSIPGFFSRAFMSWSGDYRLGEMAAENLDGFMEEYGLQQAMFIGGREVRERDFG